MLIRQDLEYILEFSLESAILMSQNSSSRNLFIMLEPIIIFHKVIIDLCLMVIDSEMIFKVKDLDEGIK